MLEIELKQWLQRRKEGLEGRFDAVEEPASSDKLSKNDLESRLKVKTLTASIDMLNKRKYTSLCCIFSPS